MEEIERKNTEQVHRRELCPRATIKIVLVLTLSGESGLVAVENGGQSPLMLSVICH
jgi:hypothetical protein